MFGRIVSHEYSHQGLCSIHWLPPEIRKKIRRFGKQHESLFSKSQSVSVKTTRIWITAGTINKASSVKKCKGLIKRICGGCYRCWSRNNLFPTAAGYALPLPLSCSPSPSINHTESLLRCCVSRNVNVSLSCGLIMLVYLLHRRNV